MQKGVLIPIPFSETGSSLDFLGDIQKKGGFAGEQSL